MVIVQSLLAENQMNFVTFKFQLTCLKFRFTSIRWKKKLALKKNVRFLVIFFLLYKSLVKALESRCG